MSVLVKVDVLAPMPKMHKAAAVRFGRLRQIVFDGCGFDFLAKCGEIFRPAGFVSRKDGVANRSWHKTGRAFDYDQTCPDLVIVANQIGNKQFFRTHLVCRDQAGKQGVKRSLRDYRGGSVNAYVFDFTGAAEMQGFKRIPAWQGWQTYYNRREFWHYQFDEGLTWAAAMSQLSDSPNDEQRTTIGLNDRDQNTGGQVTQIQIALIKAGVFEPAGVDGIFGAKTRNAVAAFQRLKGLVPDGLVGPRTRAALGL